MTAQTTTTHPHHAEGYCTLATCDYDRARLGLKPAKASLTVQEPTPQGHYLNGDTTAWEDALSRVRLTALDTVGNMDAHSAYAFRMVDLAKRVIRTGEAKAQFQEQADRPGMDEWATPMVERCAAQESAYGYALIIALGGDTNRIAPCDMIALAAYLVALVG